MCAIQDRKSPPRIHVEAVRRGIARVEKAGILGDGEKWTCGIAEERFPGATQIVDLYQRESIRGDIRFHFR